MTFEAFTVSDPDEEKCTICMLPFQTGDRVLGHSWNGRVVHWIHQQECWSFFYKVLSIVRQIALSMNCMENFICNAAYLK
jgi:hypothetical protein